MNLKAKRRAKERRARKVAMGLRRRCPIKCPCICHDTRGSGHDHEGNFCPGKQQ